MVVAAHPIAAAAGAGVLREGGNAVDAAVAVSLCLGVVEPYASGLGGGGFMLICPAGELSRTTILDSRGRVPSLLTQERVYSRGKPIPWPPYSGPMSAAVPGLGRALALALERFGSRPLPRLAEPAIRAAEEGFEVSETYRHCSQMFEGTMRVDEECCRIFMTGGMVMRPGDRLVQPEMGRTLRAVAREGFETLYTGEIARAILATVNRTGPLWGERDLESYPVRERAPLRARIGEFELLVTGPPSRGGAGVVQVAQAYPAGPGRPAHNSARAIASYDRTLPAVFRALEDRIGDPDEAPIPPERLADPALLDGGESGGSPGTTHYTIVDRGGTIVTASQTIGHFFGSGVVVRGWGIVLNDDITDMAPRPGHPNSISANRRSVANMNPMIVARGGRPWVAMGTPGSRRITAALSQVAVNLIAYGQDLATAVAQPRLHWEAGALHLEGGFAEAEVEAARPLVSSRIVRRGPLDLYFGGIHAACVEGNRVIGVADPRRDGVALAVER
jgi:gamma-glutamyltranspeptidase/glutathione hydrolase